MKEIIFISSSGSGTVINYGSGSDFLTSYVSGSGSTSLKVTVPTVPVPVPQRCKKYRLDMFTTLVAINGKKTNALRLKLPIIPDGGVHSLYRIFHFSSYITLQFGSSERGARPPPRPYQYSFFLLKLLISGKKSCALQ